MTLAEKLRFLADRAEDKKPFYLGHQQKPKRFSDTNLLFLSNEATGVWTMQGIRLKTIIANDLSLEKKKFWAFTEEEKTILRNLEDKWKWIARDENGDLGLYSAEPCRQTFIWDTSNDDYNFFDCFKHLFQSVQWEDEEPCYFRGYI